MGTLVPKKINLMSNANNRMNSIGQTSQPSKDFTTVNTREESSAEMNNNYKEYNPRRRILEPIANFTTLTNIDTSTREFKHYSPNNIYLENKNDDEEQLKEIIGGERLDRLKEILENIMVIQELRSYYNKKEYESEFGSYYNKIEWNESEFGTATDIIDKLRAEKKTIIEISDGKEKNYIDSDCVRKIRKAIKKE